MSLLKIQKENIRQQFDICGLPFDKLTLEESVYKVFHAIDQKERLFISTPNLNFLINATKHETFKKSVLVSDLNLADGMPIVWASKITGVNLPERVAGSTLYDEIVKRTIREKRTFKVFFFGGDSGVAEKAAEVTNRIHPNVVCVGYHDPGRGSIESMSDVEIINKINSSEADFLLIALGAKKGQEWILKNKDQLNVPVLSHLGAVVNFVAGNVKRAPEVWQKLGLEWLWRIKQEPQLWKRYTTDAWNATKLIPSILLDRYKNPLTIKTLKDDDSLIISINEGTTSKNSITEYSSINALLPENDKIIIKIKKRLNKNPEFKALYATLKEYAYINNIKISVVNEI